MMNPWTRRAHSAKGRSVHNHPHHTHQHARTRRAAHNTTTARRTPMQRKVLSGSSSVKLGTMSMSSSSAKHSSCFFRCGVCLCVCANGVVGRRPAARQRCRAAPQQLNHAPQQEAGVRIVHNISVSSTLRSRTSSGSTGSLTLLFAIVAHCLSRGPRAACLQGRQAIITLASQQSCKRPCGARGNAPEQGRLSCVSNFGRESDAHSKLREVQAVRARKEARVCGR